LGKRLRILKGLRAAAIAAALIVLLLPSQFLPVSASSSSHPAVRIGYFANITHAPALIAKQKGFFEKQLGSTPVEYSVFGVGTAAIEALKGGALDLAYVGPNPAISGYTTTKQTLLRVVGGATSGGAKFIVRPELIKSAGRATSTEIEGLKGHLFATPGLGGTQDVALRNYLKTNHLDLGTKSTQVAIAPSDNSTTLTLFKKGQIDGAWVPEPWATRLQLEGGGKLFADEATLWQGGSFATTNLVVSQKYLAANPAIVRQILIANNQAISYLNNPRNSAAAKALVQKELRAQTGKDLTAETMDGAWASLKFTSDPIASSLRQNFANAISVGALRGSAEATELNGIFDLRILNALNRESNLATVSAAGLGKE
jgi:NitT/TauT family transport system substrate-binding protein